MSQKINEKLEQHCRRRVEALKVCKAPYQIQRQRLPYVAHTTTAAHDQLLSSKTSSKTESLVLESLSQTEVEDTTPPILPPRPSGSPKETAVLVDEELTPTSPQKSLTMTPANFYTRPRTPPCPTLVITTDTPSSSTTARSPSTPSTTPQATVGLGLLHIDERMRLKSIEDHQPDFTAFEEDEENDDDGQGLWERLWERHAWYNSPELMQVEMVQAVTADEIKRIVLRAGKSFEAVVVAGEAAGVW